MLCLFIPVLTGIVHTCCIIKTQDFQGWCCRKRKSIQGVMSATWLIKTSLVMSLHPYNQFGINPQTKVPLLELHRIQCHTLRNQGRVSLTIAVIDRHTQLSSWLRLWTLQCPMNTCRPSCLWSRSPWKTPSQTITHGRESSWSSDF